jgi:exopolysaccharide production protein ExoZ
MAEPGKTRLFSIEAIRGIAATFVVLYHVSRHLNKAYDTPTLVQVLKFGHAGVDLFFVVSGFIILFVHYRDIGQPSRIRHYLSRRFSRVMPTYWIALAITLLMGLAAGHAMPSPSALVWSITLLPSPEEPILGVAWTLKYEIVFYALFCTLIFSRRAGLGIFAVWLVWILATWLDCEPLASIPDNIGISLSVTGTYNLEFFMGLAAAYWLRRGRVPMPRLVMIVGLTLLAAASAAENIGYLDGYATPARLAYGIPSALLILGAAEAERRGQLRVPAGLRLLGGASYSIYLFQFVFIGIAWQLLLATRLSERIPLWAAFLLLAGAALAGGVMMAQQVEQRLLRLMRGERPQRRVRVDAV